MSNKRAFVGFLVFVLGNLFIKSYYSGFSAFSYDEIISIKNTLLNFGHIKHESEWDNNPPFYYYCLWVWHKILPIDEFNSRFFSVLCVSFSIGLTFLFCRKYLNTKTAFLTGIILSLSNFVLFYAQEARTYSLILLLTLASSLIFFNYIKSRKISTLCMLSLVNFLLVYSHYISAEVILVQYIVVFFYFKESSKIFIILQTSMILIFVFLRFTKKQFFNILNFNKKEDFWLKKASFGDLITGVSELFYNWIVALIFFAVFSYFIFRLIKESKTNILVSEFYCMLLGFFTIIFLFSIGIFKTVFLPRYLIFSIPFATASVVFQFSRSRNFYLIVPILIIVLLLTNLQLEKGTGKGYKAIAEIVTRTKKQSDQIIINTKDNLRLFEYYYERTFFLKYKNIDSVCQAQNIFGVNSEDALIQALNLSSSKVYLVQSFHQINKKENRIKNSLAQKAKKVFSTEFYKGIEFSVVGLK